MQERTARLNAEADLQSLRAQVTPTGVPPTVDHAALAPSVARAVVAGQTASRTEPLNANADMHTVMLQVEGKTAVTPNVAVIN